MLMQQDYGLSDKVRTQLRVLSILACLLILTIPLAVVMFRLLGRARITVDDEHLTVVWLKTQQIDWYDLNSLEIGRSSHQGDGVFGAILGAATGRNQGPPLLYELKSLPGRKQSINIRSYERADEIIEVIRQRTGLQSRR